MVCVKNQSTLLKRILRQIVSYVPYKNLIVIYGKSTDGTKEVAESFTEKVFWDGDEGLGAARNLGIQKSSSELVAMIDADVILTKYWHQQLIEEFKKPRLQLLWAHAFMAMGINPLNLIGSICVVLRKQI